MCIELQLTNQLPAKKNYLCSSIALEGKVLSQQHSQVLEKFSSVKVPFWPFEQFNASFITFQMAKNLFPLIIIIIILASNVIGFLLPSKGVYLVTIISWQFIWAICCWKTGLLCFCQWLSMDHKLRPIYLRGCYIYLLVCVF